MVNGIKQYNRHISYLIEICKQVINGRSLVICIRCYVAIVEYSHEIYLYIYQIAYGQPCVVIIYERIV